MLAPLVWVYVSFTQAQYVREEILPEFFQNFWVRRMALDRRNYKQVVETTVELANKVSSFWCQGRK